MIEANVSKSNMFEVSNVKRHITNVGEKLHK